MSIIKQPMPYQQQYVPGPQGNLIPIRGAISPYPVKQPPIEVHPMPPIRVGPIPPRLPPIEPTPIRTGPPRPPIRIGPVPPQMMPHHRRRHHRKHHHGSYGPHPAPPIRVPQTPPISAAPVITPAPIAVPTGKTCPTWGWMVRTNADGSETVIACTPGQPGAVGLHGLEGITDTLQTALGPNWMLYIGAGIAVWFFLKKR